MPEAPRHPGVETALTRDDVGPGVSFVTFTPGGEVMRRGKFLTAPEYDEQDPRWNAMAEVGEMTMQLCLYDLGITPDGQGEWEPQITIIDDAE